MGQIKIFKKGFLQGIGTFRITSDFGKRDRGKGIENHNGVDIGIPVGTNILAPLGGTLIKNTIQKEGAGLYLCIRHYISLNAYIDIYFMHLSEVAPAMIVGRNIAEGDYIGKTGGEKGLVNSGSSTGPHLHLGVKKNGVWVDPKPLLSHETLSVLKTGQTISPVSGSGYVSEDILRTQASFKYTKQGDVTIWGETETEVNPQRPSQETVAKERLALGIWQITKILIDSSVEGKQIADSSISTQTGSLLNFFRKVCQEPLVELMGDTYGNQYYYIVRRPPFDKENLMRLMTSAMTVVDSDQVISSSLFWNNSGIYSWYRYIPFMDLMGTPQAQLYQPAVFFPEFAAVWGSRPLALESNYYNFSKSGRWNNDEKTQKENTNSIARNAVRDFKFLVESNAYNAFTRRGTITLLGDRRIKRGTLILYSPSGEVFYVDSVQNEYSVNIGGVSRTTILNVSRGMYPDYIYGVKVNGIERSYFNIIDFGKLATDADLSKVTVENWTDFISSWKVNLNSFSFFMSKQQVLKKTSNE